MLRGPAMRLRRPGGRPAFTRVRATPSRARRAGRDCAGRRRPLDAGGRGALPCQHRARGRDAAPRRAPHRRVEHGRLGACARTRAPRACRLAARRRPAGALDGCGRRRCARWAPTGAGHRRAGARAHGQDRRLRRERVAGCGRPLAVDGLRPRTAGGARRCGGVGHVRRRCHRGRLRRGRHHRRVAREVDRRRRPALPGRQLVHRRYRRASVPVPRPRPPWRRAVPTRGPVQHLRVGAAARTGGGPDPLAPRRLVHPPRRRPVPAGTVGTRRHPS